MDLGDFKVIFLEPKSDKRHWVNSWMQVFGLAYSILNHFAECVRRDNSKEENPSLIIPSHWPSVRQ